MDVKSENHLHNRLSDINARLRKLDSRLARVANNVCGPIPESPSDTPKAIDEHLHDKLDTSSRIITAIEEEMTRVENAIGQHQSQPPASTGIGRAGNF